MSYILLSLVPCTPRLFTTFPIASSVASFSISSFNSIPQCLTCPTCSSLWSSLIIKVSHTHSVSSLARYQDLRQVDVAGQPDKYGNGNVEHPTLLIKNSSASDMGEYTCRVSNEVGASRVINSAYVSVLCEYLLLDGVAVCVYTRKWVKDAVGVDIWMVLDRNGNENVYEILEEVEL